jgi:hypothetical protein
MNIDNHIREILIFYFGFIPEKPLYRFSVSKEAGDAKLPELHTKLIEFYEADMTQPIKDRVLKMSYRNILYNGRFYFKRGLTILRKLARHIGYNLQVKSHEHDRRLFILETTLLPVILRPMTPPGEFSVIHLETPRFISFKIE